MFDTEKELRAYYQEAHDLLTQDYYGRLRVHLSECLLGDNLRIARAEFEAEHKAVFDEAHAKNWQEMDIDLLAHGWAALQGKTVEERLTALELKVGP